MTLAFVVITISDRSFEGTREDRSGPVLVSLIEGAGWKVNNTVVIPDEYLIIKNTLENVCENYENEVILTTGGTGFSPRDITPEATNAVIHRLTPGLDEAMRSASQKINPHAMLSRGLSGIRGSTLIINLPGSPKAAKENLMTIIPVLAHAVDLIRSRPEAESGH